VHSQGFGTHSVLANCSVRDERCWSIYRQRAAHLHLTDQHLPRLRLEPDGQVEDADGELEPHFVLTRDRAVRARLTLLVEHAEAPIEGARVLNDEVGVGRKGFAVLLVFERPGLILHVPVGKDAELLQGSAWAH
jgi:hypothetical protein